MNDAMREWARTPFGDAELVGDPSRHLSSEELDDVFGGIDEGFTSSDAILEAIVVRQLDGGRGQPTTAQVTTTGGLAGDRWASGKANPGDQLSMMNIHVASGIANGQSVALF